MHRMLRYDPWLKAFSHNENNPLAGTLFFIDELSMVDIQIMRTYLKAIPSNAQLVMVGDADQLPSIGPGRVLADLIDGGIQTAKLSRNEVFRQARDSLILKAADAINQGKVPEYQRYAEDGDFTFVPATDPARIQELLIETITKTLPGRYGFDSLREVQCLAPINRGALGNNTLNALLQERLNHSSGEPVMRYGNTFHVGDKVLQTENNYSKDCFNGDLGYITSIDKDDASLTVDFNGQRVEYGFDELDQLMGAYCHSVHRSQGSEYPAVVMPMTTSHYVLLTRPLLYTAITRGKQRVVLVGDPKALSMAVRNHASGRPRVSTLAPRLRALLGER